jgi:uncharacterized protein YqgV (UPF0045/DUF77 family)
MSATIPDPPPDLVLEFTVEPFSEGHPGPHVVAAFDAAAGASVAGGVVEIGPFGTTVTGPGATVIEVASRVTEAAFANGATRVSLQISSGTVGRGGLARRQTEVERG